MSEDFNIDLELDEAAEARIAHAEYLTFVKDWAIEMASILEPFANFARMVVDHELDKDSLEKFVNSIPYGAHMMVDHLNSMYKTMQDEAIKILGAPFQIHEEHHELCGDTMPDGEIFQCGHQDHYTINPDKEQYKALL